MTQGPIQVNSEIGRLKTVLLKRPGKELENLVPDHLSGLLFDDIPYLKVAQEEHDKFAQTLRDEGVEVVYLEKLAAEAIADKDVREQFIDDILAESQKTVLGHEAEIKTFFAKLSDQELIDKIMAGVRKEEIELKTTHLVEYMDDRYPFYLDPMPNLYFTRDPQASVGRGMTINRMYWRARRRESLFMTYILKYHPRFKDADVPVWLDRNSPFNIEGGDELILSKEALAIGISERTSAQAIERLARNIFKDESTTFKKVIAIEIPNSRTFMHLDTVFTMIDYDKFTVHSAIFKEENNMNLFTIEYDEAKDDIKITHSNKLRETLADVLGVEKIEFIPTGNGDVIDGAREQWNDGSNTLCIRPGVVVTYDRNYVSNQLLRDKGIKVLEITGSELVRGRGGPRCMSQPLFREDI
ncbi:arginine deiminase [Staphylococcus sp. EG-SA-6]|uniref:Arginine deiminase n=8 Tax=Staphylococcus TaxID=1279 RepID=ARCA_STAHJ|nr:MULTISPECIES: arginine deiminase [Staphylococcus]Q4L9J9.1 RecName: Full=Arginine deiminase; Short=ADI; AltName: Full=Arginine dihydrolase; Short=AD [Staphylococcus haemolyticus JCSC1435]KDP49071.1 arginine deiminase [Staphylococcus aureus subsp. aureus CO-98]MBN4933216.1 arginine deiminase [Staphylococcus sp. EG-SA-6]MBY6179776.1 arginine deiminase [Staphylococcaceae bacterium DP2N0-1]MDU2097974.1 arginine deiminase [Staphylococcus sp.]SII40695.1 Arginine deiminase [Mycobacteroides abscess